MHVHVSRAPLLALLSLGGVLGATAGATAAAATAAPPTGSLFHERAAGTPLAPEVAQAFPSLAPLVKLVKPAVVNIYTTQHMHRQVMQNDQVQQFFGFRMQPRDLERQSLGSGFLIDARGYLLTNNHVISGADQIKVKLADGRELSAKVVGTDPKTDVALLKLQSTETNFPFLFLGDSDALEVGDWVFAIGNPFGLGFSATHGMVAAKERSIPGAGPYEDFIQSDALINPGNSGGPLFNMKGEVVGITNAINPNGQGIGFAIPIKMAKQILPQLETGHVVRGWLGVGIQSMTPELAAGLGAPNATGALITQVIPGGPAEHAGLHQGDIIVSFNGKAIATGTDLTRQVGATPPGTKVPVKIIREGASKSMTIKIDELHDGIAARAEDQPEADDPEGPQQSDQQDPLGLVVRPVHPQLAQSLGLRPGEGVQVVAVNPEGPASEVGVQSGDVILEVNRQAVKSPQDYRKALKATQPGQMALLRLQRRQDLFYVTVKLK